MTPCAFRHLVHSDWSRDPPGRWTAHAWNDAGRWHAAGPSLVGPLPAFVDRLIGLGAASPALAGFDFPIGLPVGYGEKTGFSGFREALPAFGTADWDQFFDVALAKDEISTKRPFYPSRPGGTILAHLLTGHRVKTVEALTRQCERGGNGLTPAGCMFWTLGAKQVGKAALNGWQTVVRPALLRDAKLWPFDGALPDLAQSGGLTLAETYPGDAYDQLGLPGSWSKRRQSNRIALAPFIITWAETRSIVLDEALRAAILAGFPPESGKDNGFDAVIGLLAMIAVAAGERPDGAPPTDRVRLWEGWILGRDNRLNSTGSLSTDPPIPLKRDRAKSARSMSASVPNRRSRRP